MSVIQPFFDITARDRQTVTAGSDTHSIDTGTIYTQYDWSGYKNGVDSYGNIGSISDGTANVIGGLTIKGLYAETTTTIDYTNPYDPITTITYKLYLQTTYSSSAIVRNGWNLIRYNGRSYYRTATSDFDLSSGGNYIIWGWDTTITSLNGVVEFA